MALKQAMVGSSMTQKVSSAHEPDEEADEDEDDEDDEEELDVPEDDDEQDEEGDENDTSLLSSSSSPASGVDLTSSSTSSSDIWYLSLSKSTGLYCMTLGILGSGVDVHQGSPYGYKTSPPALMYCVQTTMYHVLSPGL